MTKSQFNVQDQFLNQVRREKVKVIVELLSGEKVEGTVISFDNFSIIVEDKGYRLIYKHGISSIYPSNPSPQLKFFEKGS
ncbi:MAG: RNA chaperone Hfq [Deltaproteobacteria bacterium]|nr:MAG: RNA chaperone Hfq [Deltaproteobacteria bacterium]